MTASLSFSQDVLNNKDSLVCLPSHTLRGAAQRIIEADEMEYELFLYQKNNKLLNQIINQKDSLLYECNSINRDCQNNCNAYMAECNKYKSDFTVLKNKYNNFKIKDGFKMGICATIIVGLTYALITKK